MRLALFSPALPAPAGRAAGRALLTAAIATGLLAGAVAPAQAAAAPATVVATPTARTTLVSDPFARAISTGWGVAPVGGQWVTGATGAYSVASSAGRHLVTPGRTAISSMDSAGSTSTDVRVDVALDRAAGPGASANTSVLGRVVAGAGDYRARLAVTSTGALQLHVARKGTVLNKVALTGLAYAPGARMSVRVEVAGVSPTAVRAKAWPTGAAEPISWQVTATDSTAGLQQAGRVGVSTYSSSVATAPVSASYHSVQVSAVLPPKPVTAPAPAAPTTSRVSSAVRSAFLQPFASTSVWNTAVGSRAAFEGRTGRRTASFLRSKPVINRATWSTPVYRAKSTDVLATLKSVRTGQSWKIRIPAIATGAPGSGGYADGHATIVQPDGRTSFDTYKLVKRSSTVWEAQIARVTDLTGTGTHLGVRAAGTPGTAGLIRAHELRDRRINHALAIAVPDSVLRSGFVWPAKSQDANGAKAYTGKVPMGTLLAIPGSTRLGSLGLSPEGLALAKALQNHGAYVVDRSRMAALYCEQSCDAGATARMAKDWKKLHGHLRVVTNSGPRSVGGGGIPRVPAPAPLG